MLNSLKPVKNTTNLTANLTEASMLNPITSNKNKTNLMEASMLNTLKTNLILTRAVLIALFAGLFILAACGGGSKAAAPIVEEDPDEVVVNACDNNPFGTTCTRPEDVTARATAITDCATSIDTKATENCVNVPQAVQYCLRDPLATTGSTACNMAAYNTARQGSGVTLATLTSNRRDLCREGSNRNDLGLCTSTVVQNCGDDANPFDLLCGRLNPARDAIIEKCVNGATLADNTKNADCVAARAVGFTCFDDPWAESCLTSTMYREFAAFRADAQTGRLEYCMGDDADAGVCGPALARVCSASGAGANPFSDLCMATNNTYDSVRAAFATNCFNREVGSNDGTDCSVEAFSITRVGDDTLCGVGGSDTDHADCATSLSVQDCVNAPFSTNCEGSDVFDNTREALLGACTNGVSDEKDLLCGQNGGFSTNEITCINNPFTPDSATPGEEINCGTLFTALGDANTLKSAQDNLITACTTGADIAMNTRCEMGIAGAEVAGCLANPFGDCDMILGSPEQAETAQNNLIAACTGADVDGSNPRCMIATDAEVTACFTNPFGTGCVAELGMDQATAAQNNLITLCFGDGADGTNARCTIATDADLTNCLRDPFIRDCDMTLGATQAMTAQSNLLTLCTAADSDALATNTLCTDIARGGSDNLVNSRVEACLNNPFLETHTGVTCETVLGGADARARAQANLIALCTGADADGANALCTIAKDTEEDTEGTAALTVALRDCLADPFSTGCDTELGDSLTTAQSNVIALCAGDAITTNALCMGLGGDVKTCIDDPFTPNAQGGINCGTSLGATVRDDLQSDIVNLCTGEGADGTHARCVNAVATRSCLTNPFDATTDLCSGQLGDLLATAKSNVIALCTGDDALAATNPLCRSAAAVVTCLTNPFDESDNGSCAGATEVDLTALQNNRYEYCLTDMPDATLCTDTLYMTEFCSATSTNENANIFHANCDDVPTINEAGGARATYCTNNVDDDNCSSMTACGTNPFGTTCFFDGNRYDDDRATDIAACDPTESPADPDCADVIVEAADSANNITVGSCKTNPFLTGCGIADFDATRETYLTDCVVATPDSDACTTVVRAAGSNPTTDPAVTVIECFTNPFASGCDTLEIFAARRTDFFTNCEAANDAMDANCTAPIGDTTVDGCRTDPFHADCLSLELLAGVRCTAKPFSADCIANDKYDGARCAADPFYMDCAMDTALDDARDAICMVTDAGIFNVNCTEDDYTGTNAARKTFADGCRADDTGEGCDRAVSDATGAPTIAMCNTNPYATGCDTTIFADALTAYCADGAATIFNTNCDSRTNIATARSVAIGACVAVLTTDKTNTLCADRVIVAGVEENTQAGTPAIPAVTVGSCLDDPFHTACNSNPLFQFARDDHMEVCMSNGNAILPSCAAIAAAEPCVANPFLADCMNPTTGHRYRNARLARYAFCQGERAGGSTALTALCEINGEEAGSTIQNEICAYDGVSAFADRDRFNPFSSVCGANANAKIDYCGNGDNRNTQADCKDSDQLAEVALGCLENPFAATCTGDSTINAAVKTRITTKRVAYCLAVDAEGFDATLCNIDDAVGVENEICGSQGANANPFAALCTLDDADFATQRATFVQACGALTGGATRLGANADGATCAPEVIACYATPFMAGTGATDCLNEPAYAMARQGVVDRCVIAFNGDTHVGNADCDTIVGVGQLECITTNPYLNRAEVSAGGVTMPALNCAGNSSYDAVRTALESDAVCNADGSAVGSDARCGIVLVSLCGSGTTTDGDLVIGADPFNAKFCLDDTNRPNYVDQRKTLVDSCVLDGTAAGCTTQINACIADPFLVDGIAAGVNCDDDRFKVAFQARSIAYCGLESKDVGGTLTANISRGDCRAFATVLGGSNGCVLNPFGSGCDNDDLGGAADALTTAQTLRATYCATLGTSDAIRSLAQESVCRGAVSDVCKDDALFDGAGTYNCFSDKHDTYNTARETYATTTCSGDTTARAGADCDMAIVEICTTTNGLQTNPWADACEGDTTAQRLAVVTECDNEPNDGARLLNPRCVRTGALTVRTNCILDPRRADCNDYADAGEPFAAARLARYISSCAGTGAYTADAVLCPEQLVKDTICLNSTAGENARPFATICTETSGGSTMITAGNLKTSQEAVLIFCQDSGNSGDDRCTASNSAMAILAVCGAAADKNPFSTTTITGFGAGVNCNAYDAFISARTTYETKCEAGTDPAYTKNLCTTAINGIATTICGGGATLNAKSNPFNPILCTGGDANLTTKETLALACVNQNAGTAVTGGAICIQTTRDCATNPFGTNCSDAGYNKQKTAVLDACKVASATSTGSGTNARCTAAIALPALICLKDPFSTCDDTSVYNIATGTGADYITEVRTNRRTYCNVNNNINTQTAICRSATQLAADCLQNPFSANCENEIGAGIWDEYRTTRVNYCKNLNAAQGLASSSSGSATIGNAANSVNLCNVAGMVDAVDAICGDTNPATFVAGANNTNDPFITVCRQLTEYNPKRRQWLDSCLSATVPHGTSPYACNYTTQRAYCNVESSRPTNCPAVQATTDWRDINTNINGVIVDPVGYETIRGVKNNFINNFGSAEFPDTYVEALNSSGTTGGTAARARVQVSGFPGILALTARTIAVNYTINDDLDDNTAGIQVDNPASPGNMITVTTSDTHPGHQRYYVGISPLGGFSVGAPIFDRSVPEAVWNGSIHWIGNGAATNSQPGETAPRTNFKMRVNYETRVIEGAVSVAVTNSAGTGNHLVIDGDYTQAGIINGKAYIRDYTANPNGTSTPNILAAGTHDTNMEGIVSGILGYRGAVGVFVGPEINGTTVTDSFSGGFVVRPQ